MPEKSLTPEVGNICRAITGKLDATFTAKDLYGSANNATTLWDRSNQLYHLARLGIMAHAGQPIIKDPELSFEALFEVMAHLADEVRMRLDEVSDAANRLAQEGA